MFSRALYLEAAQSALDAYDDVKRSGTCIPLYSPETDTHGFVRLNWTTLEVSFRGTHSARNWLTDAQVRTINIGGMRVHSGFWRAFQSIVAQLQDAVVKFPTYPVIVTGHSLGAAIAKFAAAHLAKAGRAPIAVITFGEPRQGDRSWTKFYDGLLGDRTVRVVHQCDIVPRVPVHWWLRLYRHTENNLFFDALCAAHWNMLEWLRLPSDLYDIWVNWKLRGLLGLEEPVADHGMDRYLSLFASDFGTQVPKSAEPLALNK